MQLTREQARSVFCGSCLARGVAMLGLTAGQMLKLFPNASRRKNASKLRAWATRIAGAKARAVLASASWHQIRAAAAFDDEEAQIRAAVSYALGITAFSARPKRVRRIGHAIDVPPEPSILVPATCERGSSTPS
ncbi:MAG: hypothetical protein R3F14_08840 [Polyangiaceae bacterium]